MLLLNKPVSQIAQEPQAVWALRYGDTRTPLAQVVTDDRWPNLMWRIVWPDGRSSDLGNLSRIRDAAKVLCQRGPPQRNPNLSVGGK